jgi:diguanylate cyclase (GGDEF)-like protein
MRYLDLAIAISYFVIPFLLLPLLGVIKKEAQYIAVLISLFIICCGIGHLLDFFEIHTLWHGVTAIVSWLTVFALAANQKKILLISQTSELFDTAFDQALSGKVILQNIPAGNDLLVLKVNPKAIELSNNQLVEGNLLTQSMPHHKEVVYPYNRPLIDLYLEITKPTELEFMYRGDTITSWFLNLCAPLPNGLLYMNFIDISGVKEASVKDYLTNMYSRRILESEPTEGKWKSCIYLDLDKFKQINDTRGHAIGDRVLVDVGRELKNIAIENHGIAIREGGDEFVFLFEYAEVEEIAKTILAKIQGIHIDSEKANISASIGIAYGEIKVFDGCSDLAKLMQAAETASRKAKTNKKSDLPIDRIVVWDDKLSEIEAATSQIEVGLKGNIEDELWLAYQPIVNLLTGEIVGAEALLRWQSPTIGFVSPARFIPIAENNGSIYKLSNWVVKNAIAQLAKWRQIKSAFTVGVNISPVELEDGEFLANLIKLVGRDNIESQCVGVEVTERGIYSDLNHYLAALDELRLLDIKLKVDDFGTGQSGLAQLLQFPFNEVKVDMSLVPRDRNDQKKIGICRTIIDLSRTLGFSVIAEGIETKEQVDLLIEIGYIYGQGYYLGKPVNATDFEAMLSRNI